MKKPEPKLVLFALMLATWVWWWVKFRSGAV